MYIISGTNLAMIFRNALQTAKSSHELLIISHQSLTENVTASIRPPIIIH